MQFVNDSVTMQLTRTANGRSYAARICCLSVSFSVATKPANAKSNGFSCASVAPASRRRLSGCSSSYTPAAWPDPCNEVSRLGPPSGSAVKVGNDELSVALFVSQLFDLVQGFRECKGVIQTAGLDWLFCSREFCRVNLSTDTDSRVAGKDSFAHHRLPPLQPLPLRA